MFKKLFILLFVLFIISSCWEESITTDTTWLISVETDNLTIDIPSNWEIIKDTENILPKAKDGEIELVVTSKTATNWFANNLLILSDELAVYTTSKDFSMLNNIWASSDYLDYNRIESKEFKFLDEELSVLYVFEAKYNLDTPMLKFLQTAHICDQKNAFFLTIAIPTSVNDTSKYEYLLSTFACK